MTFPGSFDLPRLLKGSSAEVSFCNARFLSYTGPVLAPFIAHGRRVTWLQAHFDIIRMVLNYKDTVRFTVASASFPKF